MHELMMAWIIEFTEIDSLNNAMNLSYQVG